MLQNDVEMGRGEVGTRGGREWWGWVSSGMMSVCRELVESLSWAERARCGTWAASEEEDGTQLSGLAL